MSRFNEAKRLKFIETTEQRMAQAGTHLSAFSQSVFDVYANWQGYRALEADETELAEAFSDFASKSRELVDSRKVNLAHALDIIAGGMVDTDGAPLNRQALLSELAAVPAAE